MLRTLVLLVLLTVLPQGPAAQEGTGVLRITLAITGAAGTVSPPHALLVGEEPPSRAPRRVRTGPDGTVAVRLAPGTYLVESDEPVRLGGSAYAWRQEVEIAAGRETLLQLTNGNADVTPIAAGATPEAARDDSSISLARWHESVFAVWTPTHRRSGFLADPRGLVVTNGRVVGTAGSVEVQVSPTTKVAARVLLADPARDVAVLWIDPGAVASTAAVPLACDGPGTARLAEDQKVYALGAAAGTGRTFAPGTVREIAGRTVETDFILTASAAGGPVFGSEGTVVGISSFGEEEDDGRDSADTRLTRVEELCAAISTASASMPAKTPPDGAGLPMEPDRPYPPRALEAAAKAVSAVDAYRFSSSSYDVTFITPPMLVAARNRQAARRDSARTGGAVPDPRTIDPLDHFSNWSAYVGQVPPVLMVRVTPRLVEGFWARVARGAARTQGMSLPPIKRFKPGFARLQAFCGDAEVTPIHPFKLVQRVSESDAVYEGLYVFEPGALGPPCGSVRLVLYSDTDGKGDARTVDPGILERIWNDFAPWRSVNLQRF